MLICTMNIDMKQDFTLIRKQLDYLDLVCEKFNISHTELARKAGVTHTTITRFKTKKGPHALGAKTLNKIEKAFHIPFFGKVGKVPVIGYIGAGGEVAYFTDSVLEEIDAPAEAAEHGVEALVVRGDSMYPVYRAGEYVFIIKECDFDNSYIGHDCAVVLADGRTLIKTLKRGTQIGLFTLSSYNAPDIENVPIISATPIRWTKRF